jgi:hypothetical protein
MNAVKTPIITVQDARQMRKMGYKGERQRAQELMALISKVSKASGQDTLTLVQANQISQRLAGSVHEWNYNKLPTPHNAEIFLPYRTGPPMFAKFMLAVSGILLGGVAIATVDRIRQAITNMVTGNTNKLSEVGLIGMGIMTTYALVASTVKIVRYVSKNSREIYWKFARNIEANIVRELDAINAHDAEVAEREMGEKK